jgi:hypothetical protein
MRSRDRDVVLVGCTIDLGKPRGVGKLEWGGMGREWGGRGQFTSNLGPGWTGSHHTRGGFQVSKRDSRGIARGIGKGE